MVRERFDESFERLRDQSNKLAETERTTDNFDEIVEQRVELDRLRDEVTSERKKIVSRYEPPAPDVVEPPRGYVHTKLIGKVGAAVAVALLIVAGFLFVRLVRSVSTDLPLELINVVEIVDTSNGCRWVVEATLRNDSDQSVEMSDISVVVNRRMQRDIGAELPTLGPGEVGIARASWNLLNSGDCVAVDDIDHGNLIFDFTDGSRASRGF